MNKTVNISYSTLFCRFVFSFFLNKYLGVGLLGHVECVCLVL